jgi:integrase
MSAARTVSWLIDFYDTHHAAEHVTDRERLTHAAAPLRRHFGAMAVDEIDDVELVRYSSGRRQGKNGRAVSDSTIRRELQHLRAVIRFAARNSRRTGVQPDQVPFISMPAAAEPRSLVLTDEQMDAMMAVVQPEHLEKLTPGYIFLALARWTAARRTAIEDLTWDRVDLEAGRIDYREPGRKRTKKRRVPVPIDPALRPILERARAERGNDPYVVPGGVSTRKTRARAARLAGVEDATAHTFRHTWGTKAALRGVPPAVIAAMMGDSIATVLRNYVHVTEHDLATALNGQPADRIAAK